MTWRTFTRWCLRLLGLLLLAAVAGAAWIYWQLRASLAQLDGQHPLPGLAAETLVERDADGNATVTAGNRLDAARATGFLHAQERFFQMDLMRRRSAGELSELFGDAALDADRAVRLHRFRTVARETLRRQSAAHRALVEAYTAGVNAGLAALGAQPPEYLLLRTAPRPWQPEDSILVIHAMYLTLQDDRGTDDLREQTLLRLLGPDGFRFFAPTGTEWDAALDGSATQPAPLPGPEAVDFRRPAWQIAAHTPPPEPRDDGVFVGSNSWAVDGSLSTNGAAIVANDMHLSMDLPRIWFRLRLVWPGHDIVGVNLPGTPLMVVGSNRRLAWAFTNSTLDHTDVVELESPPGDPSRYRTPDGWRAFDVVEESIAVRGHAPVLLRVTNTVWGPVFAGAGLTRYALRWTAHDPNGTNIRLQEIEDLETVEAALSLAPSCGIPAQNFIAGDRSGTIGWTIMGRMPKRAGFDGRLPVSFADGSNTWLGFHGPQDYPRVLRPPGGRLWTANNRVHGSPEYLRFGPWSTDRGARAGQIRDRLLALSPATARPADLLAIQLDDRALFLERWNKLLLATLSATNISGAASPPREQLRQLATQWEGRASVDAVAYRLTRAFREQVLALLWEPIVTRARREGGTLGIARAQDEGPAWRLLQERPAHLLNPRFASYDALLSAAVDQLLERRQRQNIPLTATWGDYNRVRFPHPLGRAVPFLSRWLDLPTRALPGDDDMPRVQSRSWGASERLVVSPGHEEQGILHLPGGQSGHFLSPFHRAGHEAWVAGSPTPLLPGPSRHQLRLTP